MYKDPRQVSGQKNIPYTRYCFFKSASILLQWRKITFFFFSGEGERRVERRMKKTQVTAGKIGTNISSKSYRTEKENEE